MNNTNTQRSTSAPAPREQLARLRDQVVTALTNLNEAYNQRVAVDEKSQNLADLCTTYQELYDIHAAIEELHNKLYFIKELVSRKILPEALERKNLDKIAIPELARSYYTLEKYSAKIVDKEAAFQWLRERDAGSLIIETVNAQTLGAYISGMIKEEAKDPPACIQFSTYNITSSSKYTPKEKIGKK